MFFTISTTHQTATDLGFLLHKNPDKVHRIELAFGEAIVFYPEATVERCTAALLLNIDPVGLVRKKRTTEGGLLDQYVNDRPYANSSFLSVAIARAFGTALSGRSKHRQDLVSTPLPLEMRLFALPCRGGEEFLKRLFEPLGYSVELRPLPLDAKFPHWGDSRYFDVTLRGNVTVHDALSHVYVLVPVLDADKHYWVGEDEIAKLLRHGEGWLQAHPARNAIARRYLKHKKHLVREAVRRLTAEEEPEADEKVARHDAEEEVIEKKISLNEQRIARVLEILKREEVSSVIDLGCGEGRLLREMIKDWSLKRVAGMDVSSRALEVARDRLRVDQLPPRVKERLTLFQSSLVYRDRRLAGYDAATAVEVIEHLDETRLASFERVVFGDARPKVVLITTPNVEFNVRFDSLPAGKLRHRDHRFEWTRTQFQNWARSTAERYGYSCEFLPIGAEDPEVGAPTQLGVFKVKLDG